MHSPHTNHFFAVLLFDQLLKGCIQSLKNGSTVVSLFLSLFASILILFLLLMSENIHSKPGLVFLYSVCSGNVTWIGRVSAMLHLLQMSSFKVLTTLFL